MKKLLLPLLLCACNPVQPEDPFAMSEEDRAACEAEGGSVARGLGPAVCSYPTPDAGKSCTSGDDCAGHMCIAYSITADAPPPVPGAPLRGQCAPQSVMFGCIPILEDGERVEICID